MKREVTYHPYDAYIKQIEAEQQERMKRNNIKSFILFLSNVSPSKKKTKKSPNSSLYIFLSNKIPAELSGFKARKACDKLLRKKE